MTQPFDPSAGWQMPTPAPPPAAVPTDETAQPADTAPAYIRDSEGRVYLAPPDKASKLLATNRYQALSPDEIEQHEVHKEEEAKGLTESLAQAASSAANQFLLGAPEAYIEHTLTPEELHRRELVQKEHQAARFLGGAAGVAGTFATGMGEAKGIFGAAELAGEAVEHGILPAAAAADAALTARVAAKAANYATQGALLAAPQTLVHAAFGDTKQAAETLLWGVGPGAALGAGSELFQAGARAAVGKAQTAVRDLLSANAGRVNEFANETAVRAAGAQKAAIAAQGPEGVERLGGFLHDEGIIRPGMTRQEIGDAIAAHKQVYGDRIGNTISSLDEALKGRQVPADAEFVSPEAAEAAPAAGPRKRSPQEAADYMREHQLSYELDAHGNPMFPKEAQFFPEEAPARPTPIKSKIEDAAIDAAIKPGEIGQKLRDELLTPELEMPMNRAQKAAIQEVIDSADKLPTMMVNGQEVVSFDAAQKFVTQLRENWVKPINRVATGGGARGIEAITPLDKAKSDAYFFAKDVLHKSADEFALAAGQPQLVGALVKSKDAYQRLSQLEKFAANLDAQEAGNRKVSLTDFLYMGRGPAAMGAQAFGAGIGGLAGGVPGAMVGGHLGKFAGAALDFVAKKWMEDKGLVLMSTLAKRAAKAGPDVFSSVMGMDAQNRLKATIGTVGDTIRRMAQEGIQETKARTQEHMTALLGSTQGLTPEQSYAKLGARLTQLTANPAALNAVTSELAAPYMVSAPEVGEAYQQKLNQSVQYLHDALPKPATQPAPFAPNYWQPTHAQSMSFHDKAQIVSNPMKAMQHVAQGTLTDSHLDALNTIYPETYEKMKGEIRQFAAEHPEIKLPAAERDSVAKFLMDPTESGNIAALQATYAQPGAPLGGAPGEKAPKGKIKDRPTAESAFASTQGPSPGE